MIAAIVWQALKLKSWANPYKAATPLKAIFTWLVILFDLLIWVGILVLPSLANSKWEILLYHRPDFAAPLLIIALCLGVIGIIKIVLKILGFFLSRSKQTSRSMQELEGASND